MIIMELVIEMLYRGIHLVPIDLDRSDATRFQLLSDTEILMPFNAIPGMGESAAQSIVEARSDGPFISIEDVMRRTKISQTICDTMRDMGCFNKLPDTNQMDLFSL